MYRKKIFCLLLLFFLIFPFMVVDASGARCYLEYPSNGTVLGDSMYLQGWAMSVDSKSVINVFIDEEKLDIDVSRYERGDVISAIGGYGGVITNPLPGFRENIDLDSYGNGWHTVKIEVLNSLSEIQTSCVNDFFINRDLAKMYIDYPTNGILFGDTLVVDGWIMSTISKGNFRVYFDDNEVDFEITRRKRDDVISAISGYGDGKINKEPGFSISVKLKNIIEGNHKVDIYYVDEVGKVLVSTSREVVIKDKARMYIDYPTSGVLFSDELIVNGWVMTTNSDGYFGLYVDGRELNYDISRRKRDDVISAISGYGDGKINKEPGYSLSANLNGISDGEHKIEVVYYSASGVVLDKKSTNFKVVRNIGRMYLDNPSVRDVDSNLTVDGWIMTPNQNYELVMFVDGEVVETTFKRRSRLDVINAISGYGDLTLNKNPGFSTNLDLSSYKDGVHYIKVAAITDNNFILVEQGVEVNLNKYSSRLYIDRVEYNYDMYSTKMLVRGWNVTDCPDCSIKLYIDDNYIKDIDNRTIRNDVLEAFGYLYGSDGQNALPGYEEYVDVSQILDGVHQIKIKVVNDKTDEVIQTSLKEFNLVKYDTDFYVEEPINNKEFLDDFVDVSGWIMTDASNVGFEFYVDDKKVLMGDELVRLERNDVVDSLKNKYDVVNSNKLPGFSTRLDFSSVIDGAHVMKVSAINNDTGEVLMSDSRNFSIKKYESDMYIDYPKSSVSGTSVEVSGWILTEAADSEFEFYIDEEKIEVKDFYRRSRNDVLEVYKDKYQDLEINKEPGYHAMMDLSNYKDGEHIVTVKLVNKITREILISKDKKFNLKKYDGIVSLEYPNKANFSNNSKLYVQGWELSESSDSVVKVYFDDIELVVNRGVRQDVLETMADSYGGISKNATPGFDATYDLNGVVAGEHILSIYLYSSFGDLLTVVTKKILVFDNVYFGIDVSSHQGNIDWDELSKNGIDFAILRLGYGDNFVGQDDKTFLNNVDGCVRNNIPYGVYLYSYATRLNGTGELNVDSWSIDSEVAHTLRVLNSLSEGQRSYLKLPVFIDMEDDSTIFLGKDNLTNFADYYCSNIEKNGYNCGVYANKNWFSNYLDGNVLGNKYDIWLAHYTDDYNNLTDYNGIYNIWQYTSSGNMSGIYSDGLDMNISFKKYW